jgi:hypothetical protein
MTLEDWATAYLLRFGKAQLFTSSWAEGEKEFIAAACIELGYKLVSDVSTIFEPLRQIVSERDDTHDYR